MNTLEIQSQTEAGDAKAPATLGTLMVYEDFATGVRARKTLEDLRPQFPQFDFHLNLWRSDVLADPACRRQAAYEAAEAGIVLISTHGHAGLAAGIDAWFGQWLEIGPSLPCALVVSLDPAAHDGSGGRRQALDRLYFRACRSGVDVFPHTGKALAVGANLVLRGLARQAEAMSPTLQGILSLAFPSCYNDCYSI